MSETTTTSEYIDPKSYRIVQDCRIDNVVYSIGSPVPVMTKEQADALIARGQLEVMTAEGFKGRQEHSPKSAEEYLRAQDVAVLYRLRKFKATRDMCREVLKLAEQTGRSPMLLEALRLKVSLSVDS